jgi:hypothetical protein
VLTRCLRVVCSKKFLSAVYAAIAAPPYTPHSDAALSRSPPLSAAAPSSAAASGNSANSAMEVEAGVELSETQPSGDDGDADVKMLSVKPAAAKREADAAGAGSAPTPGYLVSTVWLKSLLSGLAQDDRTHSPLHSTRRPASILFDVIIMCCGVWCSESVEPRA